MPSAPFDGYPTQIAAESADRLGNLGSMASWVIRRRFFFVVPLSLIVLVAGTVAKLRTVKTEERLPACTTWKTHKLCYPTGWNVESTSENLIVTNKWQQGNNAIEIMISGEQVNVEKGGVVEKSEIERLLKKEVAQFKVKSDATNLPTFAILEHRPEFEGNNFGKIGLWIIDDFPTWFISPSGNHIGYLRSLNFAFYYKQGIMYKLTCQITQSEGDVTKHAGDGDKHLDPAVRGCSQIFSSVTSNS